MANETFTATQNTILTTDHDGDGVVDPGDVVTTTVTITNNSTNTNAADVQFTEDLQGMTLTGNVNVSAIAFNDTFNVVGNTNFSVNAAGGVLGNDTEPLGTNGINLDVGTVFQIGGVTVTDGTIVDTAGGTVTLNADGSFSYESDAGFTGADGFTYTLRDAGLDGIAGNGDDLVSTGTVTFNVEDLVWFIDNSAAVNGDGTQDNPFNSIANFNAVNNGAVQANPGAGDAIYLREGTGTYSEADGINLLNGQTLIGQGENLVVNNSVLGNITVETGAAVDTPLIVVTGANNQGIQLAQNNSISGLDVGMNNATATGIADGGGSVGTLTIANVGVGVGASTGAAIDIDQGGTLNVTLESVTSSGAADGVELVNVDNSTFSVTGLTTINDATANGIAISNSQNSTFTFTGDVVILNDGVGANGDGVELQNNNATDSTFNFNGGVDITVNGTDAFGFRAQSSGIVNILNPNGDNQITSNNGTAIFINPTTFNATLNSVTAGDGGTGDGIHLEGVSGTGVTIGTVSLNGMAGDGIDITNTTSAVTINGGTIGNTNDPGGIGVDINGGSGNITIAATVAKTTVGDIVEVTGRTGGTVTLSGNLSATGGVANGIDVNNNTSGTINFTVQTQALSTGASTAVNLATNTGATINFNAAGGGNGLDITTASGTGFLATGGGTVTVQGSGNTISSSSGTALNISNTTIGANDVTFQSISSNGGSATGIILDTTGSLGGLHVTGLDGGDAGTDPDAGSGGTIANKTGVDGATTTGNGIYLNSTADVRLAGMQLNDFQNSAIRGFSVNGFSLEDSVISGTIGTATGPIEGAIAFGDVLATGTAGLTGNSLIDNVNISGSIEHHVEVYNQTGTLNLTISNSNIHDNSVAGGSDGVQMEFRGTAQAFINIDTNQFSNNKSQAIQISALEDSNIHATIQSNTITRGTQGNEGILLSNGGNADLTTLIGGPNESDGNTISGFGGVAIFVGQVPGQGTANSLLQATIQNNTVTSPVDATNHAILAFLSSETGQVSQARLLIDDNTVTYNSAAARAILVDAPDADRTPNFYATVTDNTVTSTHVDAVTMISVAARNGATGHSAISGNDVNFTGGSTATGINVREASSGTNELARGGSASNDSGIVLAANNPLSTTTVIPSAADIPVVENNTILLPATPTLPSLPLLAAEGGVEAVPSADSTLPQDNAETPLADSAPPQDAGAPPADATPSAPPAPPVSTAHPVIVDDGVLTQAELDWFVAAAIARWSEAGLTEAQLDALEAMSFGVADMAGLNLGAFSPTQITLDADAAGRGWYLDGTPLDDAEFGSVFSATWMQTSPTGAPAGHYDLLTTIMHEMGHALGIGDTYAQGDRDDLMYGWLYTGERRLPGDGEASGAVAGSITAEEFLDAPIDIGVLPFGQQVQIQWQATIDPQSNQLIVNPVNTGTVSATNGAGFPDTDTNTVTTTLDTLILGGTIWNDLDGDGLFEAGEPGIDGVALSLFVDANDDNVPDTPATPLVTGVLTAGGGNYAFPGLAPGNYIVRVDQVNFDAGGALAATPFSPLTIPEPPDPDDGNPDVDNDDNGARVLGQPAFSSTITLAYNTEPTPGTGNDTNPTLDFGFFFVNNPAPEINDLAGDTSEFTEEGPAVLLDDASPPELAATVTDDQGNLSGGSLTVSITGNEVTTEDVLGISTAGTVTLSDGTNAGSIVSVGGLAIGQIAASGTGTGGNDLIVAFNTADATPANVSTLIQALTYFNSNTLNPSTLQRTISVSVNDGLLGVDSENVFVNVVDVNDEPTLIATANNPTFTEGGAVAIPYSGATATGPEAGQTFTSMTLIVTNVTDGASEILGFDGTDVALTNGNTVLTAGNALTVTVGVVGTTATVSFAGANLSAIALQAVINGLNYRNTSDNPTDADRVIAITELVDSGSNVPPADNTAALSIPSTINVNPVNDAPAGDPASGTIVYVENQAPATLDSSIVITDADDTNLEGASVAITGNFAAGQDLLDFTAQGGIIGSYNAGTGLLTLSGSAPLAAYEAVLESVTYSNSSEDPSAAPRTVQFMLDDGDGLISFGTVGVNVTPVNDNPALNDVPLGRLYRNGDPAVVLAGAAAVLDVDTPTLDQATVTITDVEVGDLLAADTTGTAIVATYNALTGTLTLSGPDTLANYQQVLRSVTFETTGPGGLRALQWQLDDGEAANNLSTVVNSAILVGIARHDFGGDGKGDILLQNADGTPAIFLMDGLNVTGSAVLTNPGATWHIKDTGDVNADGKADIIFQNDNGNVSIWLMDGLTVTDSAIINNPGGPSWQAEASGDVNGDGMSDIIWQHDNGTPGVWLIDGLTRIGAAGLPNLGADWYVKESADFDADGNADIVLQNETTGNAAIFLMDGLTVSGTAMLNHTGGPTWHIRATGDLNADGNGDIIWQNDNGDAAIWLMDGLTVIGGARLTNPGGPAWQIEGSADVNGDGMSDILWQHDNGTPGIWLMDGLTRIGAGALPNLGAQWDVI